MRLHTVSFGCQMAFADSEEMVEAFARRGYRNAPELEDADAVLVNTCTVREHAEHRALSLIGRLKEWKEARPDRFVVVAGCAAERLGGTLSKRFPHVDLVAGAKSIEQFPDLLDEALAARYDQPQTDAADFDAAGTESAVSAFVTIMRGCNYTCTYCIVPSVRGRESYRDPETIVAEVARRAAAGAKEVMLLGQTVNSYRHGDTDFAGLLGRVDAVEGVERIRFMSPHPFFLNERMMDAMASLPKVCEHLHLPVQSGSDRLLKAMRRNYTRASYLEKLAALRRRLPDLAVTSDVIVGFPGETDEDLDETVALIAEAGFDGAYCFKYSPRAGTEAASHEGQVPEDVKERRLERVLDAVLKQTRRRLEARVGRTEEVLLQEEAFGHSRRKTPVKFTSPAGKPGESVRALITEVSANGGLIAHVDSRP